MKGSEEGRGGGGGGRGGVPEGGSIPDDSSLRGSLSLTTNKNSADLPSDLLISTTTFKMYLIFFF